MKEEISNNNKIKEYLKKDRDLFLYSGDIESSAVLKFITTVLNRNLKNDKKAKDVSLALTTWGGDVSQAYRMTRFLQNRYENIRVIVLGPCKSAGTLIAVGANELVFGLFGELGPLDVQLAKSDEIAVINSGLDTLGALDRMRVSAFNAFEGYMKDIIKRSGGNVSMKTASDIAAQLVIGLFQPMMQQINPHQLSEVNRIMRIATEYGKRLGTVNLKDKDRSLKNLIEEYPSHGFIIDKEEAETIFNKVADISVTESEALELHLEKAVYPSKNTVIIDIKSELEEIIKPETISTDQGGNAHEKPQEQNRGTGGQDFTAHGTRT